MTADVAVIIPTYNHAAHLRGALDSVFCQTAPPREVIVVDDGSTDNPGEVTGDYPGVQLIRQENQGLAAARNTGWRASTCGRLVFLDADDRLKPDAIAEGLSCFEAAPGSGFVYGAYSYVFPAHDQEEFVPLRETGADPYAALLRINCIGMHATVMYDRAALEQAGGFDPALRACEDYDLYLRIARSYPVACHPGVVAEYVQHDSNMSRDSGMMLTRALQVLDRQRPFADQRPEWREAFAEGQAAWRRCYAKQWWTSLLEVRSPAQIASAWRQARVIHRLAPAALPSALLRTTYRLRGLRRQVRRLVRPILNLRPAWPSSR